ncbi:major facilitator superfamily domain-containing protein [Aspergillus avenaceus]|uniref:Major facilitator superfamily domain-containing protein n=1 Tax=Aspergillus avenaceus TaxID=36643 RepID=A0A5N6U6X8_ASPAV|nr:major facilitator superfamily domain-containing protein [Aspergillus avenaceus]
MTHDEESPLLHSPPTSGRSETHTEFKPPAHGTNRLVVYVTFIGVFLASADDSFVISTWSTIASQFQQLSQGSWLLGAYNFGYCVSLPAYGTLSNMYGRKNTLLCAYSLFSLSCLACGISGSLAQLVLARVLAGMSGGGMMSLVSIIITDLMPASEVALFRSYANIVNVVGRSFGAPIGGYLVAVIGWRWSFIGQLPLVVICIIVALYGLPASLNQSKSREGQTNASVNILSFDFAGLISFAVSIVLMFYLIHSLSVDTEDQPKLLYLSGIALVVAITVFILVEAYWAKKPLIPLDLVKSCLGSYFVGQLLLLTGRTSLNSNLTPYFVRIKYATDSLASLAYISNSIGVSVGGLISGMVIKRTKRYKMLAMIGPCLGMLTAILIFVRYREGCFTWEVLYLSLFGFSNGILFSTQFMGMSLAAPSDRLATSIGIYYLSQQIGFILGPASSVAIVQRLFANKLSEGLDGMKEKQFIQRILNNSRFSQTLSDAAQKVVQSSYLYGFQIVPLISAVTCMIMVPIVLSQKEEKIE